MYKRRDSYFRLKPLTQNWSKLELEVVGASNHPPIMDEKYNRVLSISMFDADDGIVIVLGIEKIVQFFEVNSFQAKISPYCICLQQKFFLLVETKWFAMKQSIQISNQTCWLMQVYDWSQSLNFFRLLHCLNSVSTTITQIIMTKD